MQILLSHIFSACKMLRQALPAAGVKRGIGSDNIYAAMSRLICPNGTPGYRQRRHRTLKRAHHASVLASTVLHACGCTASVVGPESKCSRATAAEKAEEGHGGHGAPEIDAS